MNPSPDPLTVKSLSTVRVFPLTEVTVLVSPDIVILSPTVIVTEPPSIVTVLPLTVAVPVLLHWVVSKVHEDVQDSEPEL